MANTVQTASGPENPAPHVPDRPARWTNRDLPPYAHHPGRTPHPHLSPQGHSHGRPAFAAKLRSPQHWQEDEAWLFGVDLWNAGYFWEAHEAWESAWTVRRREGEQARFLQALIQAAAAHVKVNVAQPEGARGLWERARTALEPLARGGGSVLYMGLDVEQFLGCQSRWLAWSMGDRQSAEPLFPFLSLEDCSKTR